MAHYSAVDGLGLTALAAAVLALFPGRELVPHAGRIHPFRRIYLDSADGRLDRSGLVLLHDAAAGGRLTLRQAADNERLVSLGPVAPPRFASDLPPGPFAGRMSDLLGFRALLPYARHVGRRVEIQFRNAEHKMIARLQLFDGRYGGAAHSRLRPFGLRLELDPVRGYETEAAVVRARLDDMPELARFDENLHEALLASLGTRPGAMFPRTAVMFAPNLSATAANRLLLSRFLSVLEVNEKGVIEDIDTEFLHDFRIAVRRTRSLASSMKRTMPAAFLALGDELRWLGQVTSPARDLDVYLLEFDDLAGGIPKSERAALEPVRQLLLQKRMMAYDGLRQALRSPRYKRLKRRWHAVLAPRGTDAGGPAIKLAAGRRIVRLYNRVVRDGRRITDQSPPVDLHELRKLCKKLRYQIEAFAILYPEKSVRIRVKELKKLQNNLGQYQDAHVQEEMVLALLAELEAAGAVPVETRDAILHLAAERRKLQDRTRRHFARTFASFARPGGATVYRKLFEAPVPEGEAE